MNYEYGKRGGTEKYWALSEKYIQKISRRQRSQRISQPGFLKGQIPGA